MSLISNLLYINKCFTIAKCWQSFCLLPLCLPPLFYFSVPLLYCSSALPFLYITPHFLSTSPHHPKQFALLESDGMLFKVVQPARAVTCRRCPHSEEGEDFLTGWSEWESYSPGFTCALLTKIAITIQVIYFSPQISKFLGQKAHFRH